MRTLRSTKSVYEDDTHQNFVIADELAVSTVNLKIHFWIQTFEFGKEALMIKGEVVSNVKEALLKEGFSFPADIHEVKLYETQKSVPVSITKI